MKWFASHSEEDIIAKRQNVVPTNPLKAKKAAATLLRSYLKEKNIETNIEMFDVARLAETLSHFYMDARTQCRDLCKATTLTNTRHALSRFKDPPVIWYIFKPRIVRSKWMLQNRNGRNKSCRQGRHYTLPWNRNWGLSKTVQ